MKCQKCIKPATLHITEVVTQEQCEEIHLCEDCAKKYLYPAVAAANPGKKSKSMASESFDDPGSKQCTACGIKFAEFRNSGRLGCPHDYDEFAEELVPLLESIHGDTQHHGKAPDRIPKDKAGQLELAQLRRKLQQSIQSEQYEEAARIRDRIREMEEG